MSTNTQAAKAVACPSCGEVASPESSWCEACGSDLTNAVPAGPDTIDLGWIACRTDKGLRRSANEDAVVVAEVSPEGGPSTAVLVVCDGVGSTESPAAAAQAAASAAARSLELSVRSGVEAPAALVSSAQAAQDAVIDATPANPPHAGALPPSATFVAAVARRSDAGVAGSVAWLGDSRAYWLGAEALALTEDHVWDGPAEAEQAGSITRWLGVDAVDVVPSVVDFETEGEGRLLLCSDGLWGYVPEATDMASKIAETAALAPVELVATLVDFANSRGGHDNIAVAIADFAFQSRDHSAKDEQ